MTIPYFLNPFTYIQGFVRVSFYFYSMEFSHFQKEIGIFFFYLLQWAEFDFLVFFTLTGVILLDITFSIKNGDRFVIDVSVDSIIMNLGKLATPSSSDSVSFRVRLIFFFMKKKPWMVIVIHWSYAPPPTMESMPVV